MTAKRDYGQFCGLAAGLNILGERWTLLIIRELLIDTARFSELLESLRGIGPNLLTERLRSLEKNGIVAQVPVPDDLRGRYYRLTDRGEELRQPVLGLARWGMPYLHERDAHGTVRADWGFLAVQAMVRPEHIPDHHERYLFAVDDRSFTIEVDRGQATYSRRRPAEPDLTMTTDAETFIRIGARMLSPLEALVKGSLRMDGDIDVIQRCSAMLGLGIEPTAPKLSNAVG
jgi:DNA-binding HxlR family transcriptional regulator